jgi:Putative Ig domain
VARASLAPFTITVSAASSSTPPTSNTPPTISGAAPTAATVGTAYSFTPTASDSNGTALSFSVQNLPSWATFSIATGTVSGTPAAANVGSYSNIEISVSDGSASASLAPFSITVSQPAAASSGTAELTWTAPVTNTDGSALTDLAGYNIHYGTSPSSMSTVINVANAGATSYTISSLASGTWYFAVNAYTTSGLDSGLSNTGSKTIP